MIDIPVLLQQAPEGWQTQAEVFSDIFLVFLVIGTLVGTVVIIYTLHHAYKYRDTGEDDDGFDAPQLGELPSTQSDSGKSKKLFLSFGLSAIIVISVVVYSYTLLLYVEEGPSQPEIETEGNMDIKVTGFQFGWEFEYPNGETSLNTMRVPAGEDQVIRLHVTSDDVWHTFGATELRLKIDSIPGQTAEGWFIAGEAGNSYLIECFELCGAGHSQMDGEIVVMEPDEFDEWYEGDD